MKNEYTSYSVSFPDEPVDFCINFDAISGRGIKNLIITISGKDFIFSKNDVEKFLQYIQRGCEK